MGNFKHENREPTVQSKRSLCQRCAWCQRSVTLESFDTDSLMYLYSLAAAASVPLQLRRFPQVVEVA
jgi:hypothetical protein